MTGFNRGPLVLEATALPTEPQPLPAHLSFFFTQSICIFGNFGVLKSMQIVGNEGQS